MKIKPYKINDWEKLLEQGNWHPAANMFALLGDDDGFKLKDLATNIKSAGLSNPIVLLKGKVLDGRNRLRACKLAGVTPEFIDWESRAGETPEQWVVSQNSARRDLSSSQRAVAALYMYRNFKPTKEDKEKFIGDGGGKWDLRIYVCNLTGAGRHYLSDIEAIDNWARQVPNERWTELPSKPRPDVLEDIKSGLHSISSMCRNIDFWVAQAKNPDLTEQESKECPTGQLASEFVALIPKHIMEKSYTEATKWLKGEKLKRLKRYWERMEKEYPWNQDES